VKSARYFYYEVGNLMIDMYINHDIVNKKLNFFSKNREKVTFGISAPIP